MVECAFVDSQVPFSNPFFPLYLFFIFPFHISFNSSSCLQQVTDLPFFATKVRLGRSGAEEIYQLGPLNEYERYSNSFSNNHSVSLLESINKEKSQNSAV